MDITTSNFKQLFPEIKDAINSSSFICLDGEFTGLSNGEDVTSFDTPSEYYNKLRTGALNFLFVQFGLSAFYKEEGSKRYLNKTYNFYLFPRPMNRHAPDKRFLCQASSLTFLTEHGFDFNKLFKEGIPYLTQSDEDSLRELLAERQRWKETSATIKTPVPSRFQETVNTIVNSIKILLKPDCEVNEVQTEKCSGFVRKLVYQAFDNEIKSSLITLETQRDTLVAKKGGSKEQLEIERKEKAQKQEDEIDEAIGFAKVVRELSKSEKLIIGHNMLLDMCHIINTFLDPLPKNYLEFKEMVHALFPNLVDTKYMCSEQPLRDLVPSSVLQHFLNSVHKSPFILPEIINTEEKCTYNLNKDNQMHHTAGYDAYITGICFISALHYLEGENAAKVQPLKSTHLKKYLNKLFLLRTPDTYINLDGKDPQPCRDHIFHLTFPNKWTSQEIGELFSPYGGVQIWWQNETTAWAGLHDKSESKRARLGLEKNKDKLPNGVKVVNYERFTNKNKTTTTTTGGNGNDGGNLITSSPRPNKRKSTGLNTQIKRNVDNIKKSKSSNEHIETIPEEDEDSNKEVKKSKTEDINQGIFPVAQNWD